MEYWDLYDKDKNKLNKTVKRGDYLSDDEYHLVVNAWIMNDKNEFLISQRSSNKTSFNVGMYWWFSFNGRRFT